MSNRKGLSWGKRSVAFLAIGSLVAMFGAVSGADAASKKATITFWTSYSTSEIPTLEK